MTEFEAGGEDSDGSEGEQDVPTSRILPLNFKRLNGTSFVVDFRLTGPTNIPVS